MASASCSTQRLVNDSFPIMTLTVTTSGGSISNNTCNAHAKLTYSAGSPPETVNLRDWTISVDGQVKSGSYDINGKLSGTVGEWDFTVNRGTGGVARTISFSVSVEWNLTWNDTYAGTASGSGSVQTTSFPQQHTVTYNANGGSGAPSSQIKYYGTILTLSSQVPTRSGYRFVHWSNNPVDSQGTQWYNPGDQYGRDEDITLYAIWQLIDKIDFSFDSNISITIPTNSSGKAAPPNTSIVFTPTASSSSSSTNFYYKLTFPDGSSLAPVSGPFTISKNSTLTYTLTSENIIELIQQCGSETSIHFNLYISTLDNKFLSETTIQKEVTIKLNNFRFLKILGMLIGRDQDNTSKLRLFLSLQYAKSYGGGLKPSIIVKNTTTGSSYDFASGVQYVYNAPQGTVDISSSCTASDSVDINSLLSLSVSDGITTITAENIVLLSASYDKAIHIYKADSSCEAGSFIEGSFVGFDRDSNVLANEFIETSAGIYLGNTMEFFELKEKNIVFG